MVSTRSVKHKFSEGEKVLCYEPDPQKTKVLYNSKVLGVNVAKDEHGRKVVQFLIHFQGWNSTWDRFVTEDYILKDTEENRKLQKELAEKAQLTAGGNLYRRGRKKRTLSRTGSDNERRGGESDSEGETGVTSQTSFSPGLQAILELDNQLITKQNKLVRLPCSPNALEILELYMKEFTISQIRLMCHRRGHLRPTAGKNAHITVNEIQLRANLCREVADGLRVYLDFMTELALLYSTERVQFKEHTTMYLPKLHIKKDEDAKHADNREAEKKEEHDNKQSSPYRETDRRKSLRSHSESAMAQQQSQSTNASSGNTPAETKPTPAELKAHAAKSESNSRSSVDLASALGHNVVKGGEHLILRPMSHRERELLKRLVHRKLVPDWFVRQQPCETSPIPPCLIYGATHLARALVKIPEIFPHAPNHPEAKMNTIREYLNGFTKFLEEHPEWFGENMYFENPYPDSTEDVK